MKFESPQSTIDFGIAVIGMACRVPGANNIEQFWRNVQEGIESISHFSRAELEEAGIKPHSLDDPHYVPAKGIIQDADCFDHEFFGFTMREAEITDPQQRLFLECLWQALENAGQNPELFDGLIGIFAGSGMNRYLLTNLQAHANELLGTLGGMKLMIGNDKDFLTTMASYKLNLRGPSVVVQTACSTSLVAVHLAAQSLLGHECDLALAGGVSVGSPLKSGYQPREGGIMSPDGQCRPFDAEANGTVFSDGVGVVVLKRLEDAVKSRDQIHAIIRATAINNDGSQKAGFTAPSIQGQSAVINQALQLAGVPADSIGYVEAHGTGTVVGDPIEVEALSRAFRCQTNRRNFCGLGSVKSNIGHVDVAAGVMGLIKAVLAVRDAVIPQTLGYRTSNPAMNLESSPFYMCSKSSKWPSHMSPRRAGISSFGIGGTNAHAIVEEPPVLPPSVSLRSFHMLPLSARSSRALEAMRHHLAAYLKENQKASISDVAYTLQTGRQAFDHRCAILCRDAAMALRILDAQDRKWMSSGRAGQSQRVVFLFPGQGSQSVNMAGSLYEIEPLFREAFDQCAEIARPSLGRDLRALILHRQTNALAEAELSRTEFAQPAIFAVSYALARTWQTFGVEPAAMIGYSLGEYVAATISGVLELPDAVALVVARGRMMQALPGGAMLAVSTPPGHIAHAMNAGLSLAAVNGPKRVVVSGPIDAVAQLRGELSREGIESLVLQTSHAFHSAMMDPMREEFVKELSAVRFRAPRIPYLSSLTGEWITASQTADPGYWWAQLRHPVQFAAGVRRATAEGFRVFLEAGPPGDLASLSLRVARAEAKISAIASLTRNTSAEAAGLLGALGKLWVAGGLKRWPQWYSAGEARRTPLWTYPFERRRCWVEPEPETAVTHGCEHRQEETVPAFGANQPLSVACANLGLERQVEAIWSELLGRQEFGLHDSFFSVGGDSLLATQLISRIRSLFGVEIPLDSFFAEPTVAHLASLLSAASPVGTERQGVPCEVTGLS